MENIKKVIWFLSNIPDKTGGSFLLSKSPVLYFIYRELWHALGGAAIAGFGILVTLPAKGAKPFTLGVLAALMVCYLVRDEFDDVKRGQKRFKMFFDLLFWAAGFFAMAAFVP